MIRIYICDDDVRQRKVITEIVEKVILIESLQMCIEYACESPYTLLENINKDEVGLFFLDIGLKTKMNGLALAQKIRRIQPRCFIVFITAYIEMSLVTFQYKVEALDYIIKGSKENMHSRIAECMLKVNELASTYDNQSQRIVVINAGDSKIVVQCADILFFETSVNEHRIVMYAKNRKIEFFGSLKELEKELNEDFYRCHRSCIVNKKNIDYIDTKKRLIYMITGETCAVSVRMMKGFK